MQDSLLHIESLSKSYGKIKALKGLDIEIRPGKVYGLLGPNGSGKSTTLGIVLDIIESDQGKFSWFKNKYGEDYRKHIGATLETPNFFPYLDAMDNLEIVAHIKQIKSPDYTSALKLVNLYERRNSPFKTYSFGMRQRLAIAAALLGDPDVVIFDEPTNGLDPQGIAEIRDILIQISKTGKTIFMASHILDEVEKICTDVIILNKGQLLAQGTVGSVIDSNLIIEVSCAEIQKAQSILLHMQGIKSVEIQGEQLILSCDENINTTMINKYAFEQGIVLSSLNIKKTRLEDEFLEIVKEHNS